MALLNQVSHSIKIKNPMSFNKYLSIFIIVLTPTFLFAQNKNLNYNKFKQLKEEVASPNVFRTAAGAPGHEYYQNEADYVLSLIHI